MTAFEHREKNRKGVEVLFSSPTFEGLVQAVVDARRGDNIKTDYNRVFNQLRLLKAHKMRKLPKARNLKLAEAASGAKAVLKNLRGQIVSQQTINERAAICLRCPLVNKASDCPICTKGAAFTNAWNAAQAWVGKKTYTVPEALKKTYCDVCGCAHSMILPARLEDFLPDDAAKATKRPANCWIKPVSQNEA